MSDWRIPIFTWPSLVVVAIVIAALIVRACSEEVEVAVPKEALPALHRIVEDDLTSRNVSERDLDDETLRKAKDLEGRVTRDALAEDEPVTKGTVTEALDVRADYGGRVPVSFHAESTTAGDPKPGDAVKLAFAPTADAEGVSPVMLDALLIDAEEVESGGTDYVVAVTRADRSRLLAVVARSHLLVSLR